MILHIRKITIYLICLTLFSTPILFNSQCKAQGGDADNRTIFSLDTTRGLDLINVDAEAVVYDGHKAVKITGNVREETSGRGDGSTPPGNLEAILSAREETIAIVSGTNFKNGTIEIELSGESAANAGPMARGFVGIAFRVHHTDPIGYECFYLRPENGRSEDQLRRNHSVQYISHPDFNWYKLRKENPGVYESYVDLVPGEWTKVKISVSGQEARLYVDGGEQPCLIVKDLKRAVSEGSIALWIDSGTIAHFRNLVVIPE